VDERCPEPPATNPGENGYKSAVFPLVLAPAGSKNGKSTKKTYIVREKRTILFVSQILYLHRQRRTRRPGADFVSHIYMYYFFRRKKESLEVRFLAS